MSGKSHGVLKWMISGNLLLSGANTKEELVFAEDNNPVR